MIGAIADDFTGGTDVAVAFRRAGLRTVVLFGGPTHDELPEHDALVVALKTRTIDPDEAVRQSVESVRWLRSNGADQIYFKYCSTFDSRPEGNIGPVVDALADLLDAPLVVIAPSSPEHLRTQYLGHLFVGHQLLSDSPMRHHPLTPMTDSRVPALLESQTKRPVRLIEHGVVRRGHDEIRRALNDARDAGTRYAVVDAVDDGDLAQIGNACIDDVLVTGAAGLAGGLGLALARRLDATSAARHHSLHDDPVGTAPAAVLAGSCSARTLQQIAQMQQSHPSLHLDAVETPHAATLALMALDWFDELDGDSAPLIYSSLPPAELKRAQDVLGTQRSADILETAMGLIARGLRDRGIRRIVVAGGETSGAVVTALGVKGGLIGDEAAPGVPWIFSTGEAPIALLLKSGNFGDPDLLARSVSQPTPTGAPS
jgi:uncharacterized protein YgbK (DUF1537 family)